MVGKSTVLQIAMSTSRVLPFRHLYPAGYPRDLGKYQKICTIILSSEVPVAIAMNPATGSFVTGSKWGLSHKYYGHPLARYDLSARLVSCIEMTPCEMHQRGIVIVTGHADGAISLYDPCFPVTLIFRPALGQADWLLESAICASSRSEGKWQCWNNSGEVNKGSSGHHRRECTLSACCSKRKSYTPWDNLTITHWCVE